MSNLQVVIDDIHAIKPSFQQVLADPSINFERETGFAIQVLQSNDYALGIATRNRQSVVDAITNIAAIGISLNPAKKQAYLVPRDGKICLDISYMGLIDLAVECGAIAWAQANVVYESDQFELTGYDSPPLHKFQPFAKDRGEFVGVYVVVKTSGGDYLTHIMSAAEVHAIRDRSSAWKAWIEKKKKCPWVTDFAEMAKKTCVKQAYKYWPRGAKSDRLENAIHHLNTDGNEGLAELQPKSHLPTEPEGYEAFEAEWLPVLQEAAMNGVAAYSTAVQSLPKGALRDQLGMKHHRSLSQAAKAADATDVEVK